MGKDHEVLLVLWHKRGSIESSDTNLKVVVLPFGFWTILPEQEKDLIVCFSWVDCNTKNTITIVFWIERTCDCVCFFVVGWLRIVWKSGIRVRILWD